MAVDRLQLLRAANDTFVRQISDTSYPCVGARAALHAGSYLLAVYDELGSAKSAGELYEDLERFVGNWTLSRAEYATFIAVFAAPAVLDESQFEQRLWQQLRELHSIDRFSWDENVSADIDDAEFSFSVAGQAYYVIGLHANSSRLARRFPWPALVFNPHAQFERLRTDGKWKRMQQTIRERDLALQGSINPMLSDFGTQSEARQYSGRAVPNEWTPPLGKCPFG